MVVVIVVIVVINPRKNLNLHKDNNKTKIPGISLILII